MVWYDRIQRIDRRIMYILLLAVIVVPLIWPLNLPTIVSPAAKGDFDAVERMPDNKFAIVCIQWDAGSLAESQPQTDALIRHLFMSNKKFAILSFWPQGAQLTDQIATRYAREYHKEYGKDWVNWGYRPWQGMILTIQGIGRNIPKTIGKDKNGTPLKDIPMMKNVKDIKDVGLVAEITSRNTMAIWISYIHGQYRTPLWYATTAVGAPEGFNWLDSGQIEGMLVGMKGAAEYEHMLGKPDFATKASGALSTAQSLIVLLIIIGNIGYITSRRARAARERQ